MMIENVIKVQDRILSKSDVSFIRLLIQTEPTCSRWRLSREISTHWDWRNSSCQLKDLAEEKEATTAYISSPKYA
ncbi:hypothetical protein S225a_04250 [Candidatus Brocadiaceae bacterium S225]|nr:hypothetical protein S225a_04250 [Candidatus Brocadiaceae bacterium S225]